MWKVLKISSFKTTTCSQSKNYWKTVISGSSHLSKWEIVNKKPCGLWCSWKNMFLQFFEGMMTLLLIMMCWVFLWSKNWIFYQPFSRNIPKCYIFTPFCHNTHVNWLKPCHLATLSHLFDMWSLSVRKEWYVKQPFVRNCLLNLFLSQQKEALSPSFWVNTLCRWLTVGDSTLCAGITTDGTILSCSKVGHSWSSSLQNVHFVIICLQWCRQHRWHIQCQWLQQGDWYNTAEGFQLC